MSTFLTSPYLSFVIRSIICLCAYSVFSGPTLEDDAGDMDTGSADSMPGDDDRPGPSHHGRRRRRKRTKEQVDPHSYIIA